MKMMMTLQLFNKPSLVPLLLLATWSAALCRNVAVCQPSSRLQSLESVRPVIDDFVQKVMAAKSIPGLSLAIVNGDSDQFTNGYGIRRINTKDRVTNDSLFYIASTTKAMTASVLLETMSRKSIDLNTPVKELLPEFQLADYTRQEQATVGDLLAHRMGTPETFYNWFFGAVTTTRLDLVKRALYFKPLFPFRDSFTYSNLFYQAAGVVTEALSDGKSWESVMRETLFEPAQMRDTSFSYELSAEQTTRFVAAHEADWRNGNAMREVSRDLLKYAMFGAPGGAVVSSAKDLVKWLYVLTHGGLSQAGERVLNEEVIKNTMAPHSITGERTPTRNDYGFGWYSGYVNGTPVAKHDGYLFGFHSSATVYPDLKIGIFTCANGQSLGPGGMADIHDFVAQLILNPSSAKKAAAAAAAAAPTTTRTRSDAKLYQRLSTILDKVTKSKQSVVNKSLGRSTDRKRKGVLDAYLGVYHNFAYGNVSISLDSATGRLRGDYGDISVDMVPVGKADNFVGRPSELVWFFPPLQLSFGRSTDDSSTVSTLTVPMFNEFDAPVFTRGHTDSQAPLPPTCGC